MLHVQYKIFINSRALTPLLFFRWWLWPWLRGSTLMISVFRWWLWPWLRGVNPHDFIYSLCFRTCWVFDILLSEFFPWRTKVEEIWTGYNTPKCSVYSCCIITKQRNSKAHKCSQHMSIQSYMSSGFNTWAIMDKKLLFLILTHNQSWISMDFSWSSMVITWHHLLILAAHFMRKRSQKHAQTFSPFSPSLSLESPTVHETFSDIAIAKTSLAEWCRQTHSERWKTGKKK